MIQSFVVYAIVAAAAAFVLRRVVLPARAKAAPRHATDGATVDCDADSEAGSCSGCSGCGAAKRPV